jgi:hypothetical protein
MENYKTPEFYSPDFKPPEKKKRIGAEWIIAIVLVALTVVSGASGMGWDIAFIFFGFVGIVIFPICMIVAAVRKKDKNPSGLCIAGSAVFLVIGIILVSRSSTTPVQPSPAVSSNTSVQIEAQSKAESAVSNSDTDVSKSVQTGAQSKAESESDTDIFKIGETAKYNDTELTVTKVSKVKRGEFSIPKDGNEFVVVTVKYKNNGERNISYNPFDFRMKNSKGQITSFDLAVDVTKNQLESGELAPGGEVEGDIVFEEPKGDKGLILQYTGSIFFNEPNVSFKLQ